MTAVPARTSGFGPMRLTTQPRRFGLDANYAASPNVCVLGDGRLVMIWREGSGHASRDGKIMWSFSSDEGRTWTAPETWMPYPGGGIDPRGTAITAGRDGHTVWVPYFYGSDANAAMGVYLKISPDNGATWGPELRVDPGAAYAGTDSMGVIEVGDTLMLPWYGKHNAAEPYESIWLARSTDGGQTWLSTRMVDGPATGRHYHEPNLVDCDGTLVMTFRWGTADSIAMIRSTDGGQTWTAPAVVISPGSGKAALAWSSTGVLTCIYRDLAGAAVYRSSHDHGSTWTKEIRFAYMVDGAGWTVYAGACEISPGLLFVAQGVEYNTGHDCRLELHYLTDGAALTPIGAHNPDRVTRTLLRLDQVIAVDDFDRPQTTNGLGYALTGQTWRNTDWGRINQHGEAMPNLNGAHYPTINCANTNVTVEADLYWEGAGAEVDFGIVLRYRNPGNHFLFRADEGGSVVRLLVRNNGVYYTLATATTVPARSGQFRRWEASIRGNRFIGFVDGQAAIAHDIGAVDMNLLYGMPHHGLKLNGAPGFIQACRRFVVHS